MFRLRVTCEKCKGEVQTEGRDAVLNEVRRIELDGARFMCMGCKEALAAFKAGLDRELIELRKTRMEEFYGKG
jgi:aspartate/glutamate racemase